MYLIFPLDWIIWAPVFIAWGHFLNLIYLTGLTSDINHGRPIQYFI